MRNIDIVVARYKEDLDWLNTVNLTSIKRIYIYNKNSEPYTLSIIPNINALLKDIEVIIINLPNVGRESHTYLHHIINNYNNFSERVMFIQAKFQDHINFDRLLNYKNFDYTTDISLVMHFRLYHYYTNLRLNKHDLTADNWIKKYIEPDIHNILMKNGYYLQNGACFTIDKKSILSRSLASYKELISTINDHDNPEEGHFFERAWYYIFNMHKINNNNNNNNTFYTYGYCYVNTGIQIVKNKNIILSYKTTNDAHIMLVSTSTITSESDQCCYEIVLGGWNNTKSCIRRNKQGEELTSISNAPCDQNIFKTISLKLTDEGELIVFYNSDNQTNKMMSAKISDNQSYEIHLSSWDKVKCVWRYQ